MCGIVRVWLHAIQWQAWLTKFYCLIAFTSWNVGQYEYWIVCFSSCDNINFEIKLIFLIRPFSLWWKSQDKNLNNLRTKRAFKVKQKAFFKVFKGLSVAKIVRPGSAPINKQWFGKSKYQQGIKKNESILKKKKVTISKTHLNTVNCP